MSDGMYEVLALLPEGRDFALGDAVAHFGAQKYGPTPLRAELATPEAQSTPTGFRVCFGDWAVVAWLESGSDVLAENQELAELGDLPAPAAVVAGCSRRLSVWSDEDETGDHSDEFNEYTDILKKQFGALIYDPVNGSWWV